MSNQSAGMPVSQKSYMKALALCCLAGGLGAHRFYTGRWLSGLMLFSGFVALLSLLPLGYAEQWLVLACALVWFLITFVWAGVDCIYLASGKFKDVKGLPLRQQR